MRNTFSLGGAGATNEPQNLMDKVLDILRRLGLDGNSSGAGVLSKDDLDRLLKALKQLGPESIKKVLQQNPALTQTLGQVMGS